MMRSCLDDFDSDDPDSRRPKPPMTLGDVLNSPLVGMLDDLDDDRDSSTISDEIRKRASIRPTD